MKSDADQIGIINDKILRLQGQIKTLLDERAIIASRRTT